MKADWMRRTRLKERIVAVAVAVAVVDCCYYQLRLPLLWGLAETTTLDQLMWKTEVAAAESSLKKQRFEI